MITDVECCIIKVRLLSVLHQLLLQVVSSDGTKASVVYNNCTSVQTPTIFATKHDGTPIGAVLTMDPTCKFQHHLLQSKHA